MTIQEKMQFMHNTPVTSWHEHVYYKAGTLQLDEVHLADDIAHMDALGIDRMIVSNPIAGDRHCPPESFIAANNIVYEATKLYPGKVYGMAFVNPGYHDASRSS